jgi:hypothetical protein
MDWSLNRAAAEWNVDRRTLQKALEGIGVTVGRRTRYHTQEICKALFGDQERVKLRLLRAQADIQERKNAEAMRELVPIRELEEFLMGTLPPIRQRLLALPAEAAGKVNPSDPALAKAELERWLDMTLALMRYDVEQFRKKMTQ